MKKKIYGGLSIAFIALAFVTCQKEDVKNVENAPKEQITTRGADDGTDPGDVRIRPEDLEYIGMAHNDGMDALYAEYEAAGGPPAEDESKETVKNFLIDRSNSAPGGSDAIKEFAAASINELNDNPLPQEIDNFYGTLEAEGYDISDTEKGYLDALHGILTNAEATPESDLSADAISEQIADLEETIYNDYSLDNNSLYSLFSATQVARYSARYWITYGWKWRIWGPYWCHPIRLVYGDCWGIYVGHWKLIRFFPPYGPYWWYYGGFYGYGLVYYSCFGTLYYVYWCIWHWCWWPYCWW